jgi:hypothetical protein
MTESHWKRAADFAEIAEALAVPTTAIMAAMNPEADRVVVLYTPKVEEERVYRATLRRGLDGVLFLDSQPVEQVGMLEDMKAKLDAHMRETFGDPPGE